jgi:hypothetical protein
MRTTGVPTLRVFGVAFGAFVSVWACDFQHDLSTYCLHNPTNCLGTVGGAPTFTAAEGDAGRWGLPYGWLGARGTPVWEEYRKFYDELAVPYPAVIVLDAGEGGPVLYANVYQENADGVPANHAPGVFIGPAAAERTPVEGAFDFASATPGGFDIRIGFLQAPASTFVANMGGDDHAYMDLFYGGWGVNGLCVWLDLWQAPDDAGVGLDWWLGINWVDLVSGLSPNGEIDSDGGPSRANQLWNGNVTVSPAPCFEVCNPPCFEQCDLAVPASQPMRVTWSIVQQDGGTWFEASFGAAGSLSWLIDDGMSLHGLTDPGNGDGIPYVGNRLDLAQLIPVIYVGSSGGQESITLGVGIEGAVPELQALPGSTAVSRTQVFIVAARNGDGTIDTAYSQTVQVASTDPAARLPPQPHQFIGSDQGVYAFEVTFATPGEQVLTVSDVDTPSIGSSLTVTVDPSAGCSMCPGKEAWLLVGLALLARRRPRVAFP